MINAYQKSTSLLDDDADETREHQDDQSCARTLDEVIEKTGIEIAAVFKARKMRTEATLRVKS
ncbi:MAG: hypothetical protein AAF346_15210 [Pseudomonadota bacterium]